VNLPIAVPVFKEFKSVLFVPEGAPASITFIDDVAVHWRPAVVFAGHGHTTEFHDDFESYSHGTKLESPDVKSKWHTSAPTGDSIIRDTSFGPGVKSLRSNGGSMLTVQTPRPLKVGTRLTLDLDFFLRSGESPSIMPRTATQFPHSTRIGWTDPTGKPIASIIAKDGTWHLWESDHWADTKHPVHYDMWNHLQLLLNEDGTYQAAVQPVGQVPAPIGSARVAEANKDATIIVTIEPSATTGHISCYDNVIISSGSPATKN
jgi:hypothetical protein